MIGAPDAILDTTVEWKAGENGKSIDFDGSSSATVSALDVNNQSWVIGPEYTVCLWRRMHSGMDLNNGTSVGLLTKGGSGSSASISPLHIRETFPNEVCSPI